MTREEIDGNVESIKKQLSQYLDFSDGKALLLNNADWLTELNYIEFLRDIGRHFSVNRMLAAESYRMRLETGLNFIEFNYMLLQSYDFYYLCKHHNCILQMGGNDQWGNVVAGIDLTRRLESKTVYGITFPLITTSQGHKMGKTEKGTVWLNAALTSPYDYFQYWINTDDSDVERFLAMFTYLPIEEIHAVKNLADADINMAKMVLAFEATKVTHGEDAARSAWQASASAFNLRSVDPSLFPSSSIPRTGVSRDLSAIPFVTKTKGELQAGLSVLDLFIEVDLCSSKGEVKRLVAQGGAYINGEQVKSIDEKISVDHMAADGEISLRKGKKKYAVIRIR